MKIILNYFPELDQKKIDSLFSLKELYFFWNNKVNLISRKDIGYLTERHILHSLSIAKVIHFCKNTSILDVGTGGGLPGIPLAIMFPDVKFHLIDSIGKKINVVKNIIDDLGLTNVTCEQKRAEQINSKYDFIISRAVTSMPKFLNWISNNFKSKNNNKLTNGVLYLKGGSLDEEMQSVKQFYKEYNLSNYISKPFFEKKKLVYVKMN